MNDPLDLQGFQNLEGLVIEDEEKNMTLTEYLKAVDTRYRSGISTEHSYRGDLQQLLTDLTTGIMVTNEPKRVAIAAPSAFIQ